MEIISGRTEFNLDAKTAVAIGKFDGIHIGHRRLLADIVRQKERGLRACVFTFDPAPSVFFGLSEGAELTTQAEKRILFARLGVDTLIEYPMNARTAGMEPVQFLSQVLAGQLHAVFVAAGRDVSFGARGAGDAALLTELGHIYGYESNLIDKVCLDGSEVSSTRVREAVESGDMKNAARMLGAPYLIQGTVQHGNRIGRTLGMPTVNLLPPTTKLLPPCGVYYSTVLVNGTEYRGISNIGYKPTVEERDKQLGVETYIYDFDNEIYGQEITVSLYEHRRPEQRFDSIQSLKDCMRQDIEAGRSYIYAGFS